jgi:hypothetical protein
MSKLRCILEQKKLVPRLDVDHFTIGQFKFSAWEENVISADDHPPRSLRFVSAIALTI